jgi:hypothetical protein
LEAVIENARRNYEKFKGRTLSEAIPDIL